MSAREKILPAAEVAAAFMLSDLIARTRPPMTNVVTLIRKDELERAIFEAIDELDNELYLDEVDSKTVALVAAKDAIVKSIKNKTKELEKNSGVLGFIVRNWGEEYSKAVDEELWETVYLIDQML